MYEKSDILRIPLAALIFALVLSGCAVVPVRTKTVIKNPSGQNALLSSEPLVPGKTTREQVEAQYKAFEVESGVPNLYWGRFRKSKWWVFAATYGSAGAGRIWGDYNLLARFDDQGTLTAFETVAESGLLARLVAMQKEHVFAELDLSQPIHVSGLMQLPADGEMDFALSANEVVITLQPRQGHNVPKKWRTAQVSRVPLINVVGIEVERGPSGAAAGAPEPEVSEINLKMRLSKKTEFGKNIFFSAKPAPMLTLVRWLEQCKSKEQIQTVSPALD